jgi:hypothetical protein
VVCFDATTLWHSDAAEWAPSTTSFTSFSIAAVHCFTSAVRQNRTHIEALIFFAAKTIVTIIASITRYSLVA